MVLRQHSGNTLETESPTLPNLILVPTPTELKTLRPLLSEFDAGSEWAFQLCGFGPIAAAARTAGLIARYKPERVVLMGIGGSLDADRRPIGTAHQFTEVACFGIGVGAGSNYQSAADIGWDQFSGGDAMPRIADVIPLTTSYLSGILSGNQLLTVCSASACDQDVEQRTRRFPDAMVEDMEGFGVATSCTLARVELNIIRGISNVAGDRNHDHWKVEEALTAAAELAREVMDQ